MPHPLDGAGAKLKRAQIEFELLRDEIEEFKSSHPYSFSVEHDGRTDEEIGRFHFSKQPDLVMWGVRIGGIAHHLRSALDHIVWQLVIANGQRPREGWTGFPVCVTRQQWEGGRRPGERLIEGVSDEARRLIDEVQPYRRNEMFDHDPSDMSLWILNALWNQDKHRTIHLVNVSRAALGAVTVRSSGSVRAVDVKVAAPGELHDSAELARWRTVVVSGNRGGEDKVEVRAEIALDILFDETGPMNGRPVVPALESIGKHAAKLFFLLRPLVEKPSGSS
jgi:hypothetical protein